MLTIHCRNVAVEFCSKCGGVFLDKGEREKLVARERTSSEPEPAASARSEPEPAVSARSETESRGVLDDVGDVLEGLVDIVTDL